MLLQGLLFFGKLMAQQPVSFLKIQHSGSLLLKNSDMAGQLHNEALDYVLPKMKFDDIGKEDLIGRYNELMEQFFAQKGLSIQYKVVRPFSLEENQSLSGLCVKSTVLSPDALQMGCQIQHLMEAVVSTKISMETYVQQMEKLRIDAENLKDERERWLCGITASVAKYSMQYWMQHARQYDLVSVEETKPLLAMHGPCDEWQALVTPQQKRIRWWSVAFSDVYGAWNWGSYGTAAGGVTGIIALGITGAAWHSGTNIILQATIH